MLLKTNIVKLLYNFDERIKLFIIIYIEELINNNIIIGMIYDEN